MAVPKNPEPTPVKDGTENPLLDPSAPGEEIDPNWAASAGTDGTPQSVPLQDAPGVTASPGRDKTGNKTGEPDPSQQTASLGPEGAPQPVPREDDPGINANVIS